MTNQREDRRGAVQWAVRGAVRGRVPVCLGSCSSGEGETAARKVWFCFFFFFPPAVVFFWRRRRRVGDAFRSFFAFCFLGFVFPGRAEPPPALRRTGAQRTAAAPRR